MKSLLLFVLCAMFVCPIVTWAQEVEPNGQKSLADPIADLTIRGNISGPNDIDWFVLLGQEGDQPDFTINHAGNVDFDFEVFNNDTSVGRATGSNSGDSIHCQIPGRCYVKVWSARGTGAYTINIRPTHPRPFVSDEREPNDIKAQADLVKDLIIAGSISKLGDVDWFVLNGQEGSQPKFVIHHPAAADIDFEVFSNDVSAGKALGSKSGDSIQCKVPGKCHVKVWSAKGTGIYSIRILPHMPDFNGWDEREPNDTKELADKVQDMNIQGFIQNQQDVDWYFLSGQEGVHPTFTITHDPRNDFDFEVFSGDKSVGKATGVNSGDSIKCNVPGKCYVKVWSFRSQGNGWYRINVKK